MPLVSEKRKAQFLEMLRRFPERELIEKQLHLYDRRARECMQAADLVILSSGTATLECMLVGRPMVIIYKVSPVTELILRMILKTRTYGLPNLLHGEKIVPELVQRECTGANAAAEAERILEGAAGTRSSESSGECMSSSGRTQDGRPRRASSGSPKAHDF